MSQILLGTGVAPAAPSTGQITVYAKTADKGLYYKDEFGIETGPLGVGYMSASALPWILAFAAAQG